MMKSFMNQSMKLFVIHLPWVPQYRDHLVEPMISFPMSQILMKSQMMMMIIMMTLLIAETCIVYLPCHPQTQVMELLVANQVSPSLQKQPVNA